MKRRGDVEIWLSQEIIDNWYNEDFKQDGTGKQNEYSDFAVIICHEIRKVFKLPLRQTEGFINSLFRIKNIPITCPSYSFLSKRLNKLNIKCLRYKKIDHPDADLAAIAIDSTGLKRFVEMNGIKSGQLPVCQFKSAK